MKKYVYLFLCTAFVISAVVMSGFMLKGTPVECDVLILKPQSMDNTVTATGRLQYKEAYSVRNPFTGIMNSISVENGSEVQSGDLLYSYYKIEDAYTALLSGYTGEAGTEGLLGMLSQYTGVDELLSEVKKYCTVENVYAEKAGRVTGLRYHEDELIEKNAVTLKLSEKDTMEIPVNINENYIDKIEVGQSAVVVFSAASKQRYPAKVTSIAKEASVTSGLTGKETTVEVVLTLQESDEHLRPGYSASCTIVTSTDQNVIVVPYDAVVTNDDKSYVYLLSDANVRKQEIMTGKEYKDGIEALKGLQKDDVLILNADRVREGDKIKIHEQKVQTDA